MSSKSNRRDFLKTSALVGAGAWVAGGTAKAQNKSANGKLNIATVGAGGMAGSNIHNLQAEAGDMINFVAFSDVDHERAAGTFKKYPNVKKYFDFRKMLDENHNEIDAVLVACPDNCHAVAAMAAMKLGKHVYCEKPLTHDVYEARMLTEAAHKYNVVTQMGNMGTSKDGFRQGIEIIRSGAIGPVREIHVWTNRPVWPQGIDALLKNKTVLKAMGKDVQIPTPPDTFKWDLWLGPAPMRAYDTAYYPFDWRGWWDYGTGALGDMACHTANLPFMACELGAPSSLEAEVAADMNDQSFPSWSVIKMDFPARGDKPAVDYTWYDGGSKKPQWMIEKLAGLVPSEALSGSGFLLIGDKGQMYSACDYGSWQKLLPEKQFKDYTPPSPTLPRVGGAHRREWVEACLGKGKTMSNFDVAGPLTEMVVLGCVAMKFPGRRLEWDAANMRFPNMPEADQYLKRQYREGWSL